MTITNPFEDVWVPTWEEYRRKNPRTPVTWDSNPFKNAPTVDKIPFEPTARYIMNEIVKTSGSDTSGMIAGLPVIVLDLLEHMNEDKVTTVVAGGYCTDYFMDYKNKRGDIDLFFDSKESMIKANDFLNDNLSIDDFDEQHTDNARTFLPKNKTPSRKIIQLIQRDFFYHEETQVFHKQKLFNSFDFESCCCLVTILPNGKEIGYCTRDFLTCIKNGITIFTNPWRQNILARNSGDLNNYEAIMTLTKRLPKMNAKGFQLDKSDLAFLLNEVFREMRGEDTTITQETILKELQNAENTDAYQKPKKKVDNLGWNLTDSDLVQWFEKHKDEIYNSQRLPHGMVSGAWSSNSSSAMTQFIEALQRDKGFAYEAIQAYLNRYPRSKNDSPYISFALSNYVTVSYDYTAMDSVPMIDTITMTFDELGDILKRFDLAK